MKIKGKIIPALILAAVLGFAGILILYSTKNAPTDASISYPDGYTVITADDADNHEEFIELLGFGVNSFKKYLNDKHIVSFAANQNNSRQFRLVVRETDFTKQLVSIAGATNEDLAVIAKELLPGGYSYVYRVGGNVYYEIDSVAEGDNGEYCTLQFITVRNGKYYALIYNGSRANITTEERRLVEDTVNTLKIPDEGGVVAAASSVGVKRIFYLVIVSLVIIAGVVCIILNTYSLVKDIRNRKKRDDYSDIVIKRRHK